MPEGIFRAPKKPLAQGPNFGLERFACAVRIGREQPVIDKQFHLAAIEANAPLELRIILQAVARANRCARRLFKAILQTAAEKRFAIVTNAQAVIRAVHTIICFVPDQDHSGASGHVAVISNIQQKLLARLILNPTVKDRNNRFEVNILWVLNHQLYVHVLDVQFYFSIKL